MKIYQKPSIQCMEMQTEGMIADSVVIQVSKDYANDGACAKENNGNFDWDEEETTMPSYSSSNVWDEQSNFYKL